MPDLQAVLRQHLAGALDVAEAGYRARIDIDPQDGNAWNLLGVLLHQTGRDVDATVALRRATELLPSFADAHSNRAMVALALGDLDTAEAAIGQALAIAPTHPAARVLAGQSKRQRGAANFSRGDFDAALADFSDALTWQAGSAELHLDCANALRRLGRTAEALVFYRRAVDLASSPVIRARCEVALATVLRENGQWSAALDGFLAATRNDPTAPDAWQGAGVVWMETGHADTALACLQRAVELAPTQAGFHSAYLGALNYVAAISPAAQLAAHRDWARRHAPVALPVAERPAAGARWRVGLLSADLREHPVARFLESWLPFSTGGVFDFFVYSDAAQEDDTSRRLNALVSGWTAVGALTDAELAAALAADRLDLLIELSGHTAPNRLPALAGHPARRIWSWIGYPATTGLSQIDGRLTDAIADPAGSESFYSEQLLRLPDCFLCYCPPGEVRSLPPESPPDAAPGFVFGSFNNLSKITDEVVAVWAEILQSVPGSRLRLKSGVLSDPAVATDLAARFATHGLAADRLELIGHVASPRAHFAQYNLLDLALDPFPYNGTTTTCDALWMGVPVLTMVGDRHAGRVGATLLRAALGDEAEAWQAIDRADYVRKACAFAHAGRRTSAQRQAWRRRIAASPLLDGERFATQLAALMSENLEPWKPQRAGGGNDFETEMT